MSNSNSSGGGSGMMMVMVIGIAASACCSMVSSGGLGYLYYTGGMCESLEVGCEYTTLGNTTTVAVDSNVTTDCFAWASTQCAGKTGTLRETCMATNKAACMLKNPSATWVVVTDKPKDTSGSGGGSGGTKSGKNNKTITTPTGMSWLGKHFTRKKDWNWTDPANALTASKYSAGGYMSRKTATECGKVCHADSKCKAFAVSNNKDGSASCWMKSGLVGTGVPQTGVNTYLLKGYTARSPGI